MVDYDMKRCSVYYHLMTLIYTLCEYSPAPFHRVCTCDSDTRAARGLDAYREDPIFPVAVASE